MADEAHPGKMHLYNARGYCWCGVHRDDGLVDAIATVFSKKTDTEKLHDTDGSERKEEGADG